MYYEKNEHQNHTESLIIMPQKPKQKNEKIISEIYEKYLKFMRGAVFRRIHDIDTVDDIVQECMLKFIRHSDTLSTLSEPQLISYIRITVENAATDHLRKIGNDISLDDNQTLVEKLTIQNQNPVGDEIELTENKETLIKAIKQLKQRDRDLITLKIVQNIPDSQIAETMGIKPSSVRMTVRRSIEHLKKIVKEMEKDD